MITYSTFSQEYVSPVPSAPPLNNTDTKWDGIRSRIFVGGNVGASFGTITYINISPLVGYKITDDFSAGAGFTYNYISQKYGVQKITSTIYGSNVFARYSIFQNLFAQVGWDRLSVSDYRSVIPNSRVWIDNILVGGGYKQPFSERGNLVAMIFYNINQTPLSPYPNPIIQIGFNLGI
jgi:hypothetical protein